MQRYIGRVLGSISIAIGALTAAAVFLAPTSPTGEPMGDAAIVGGSCVLCLFGCFALVRCPFERLTEDDIEYVVVV